MGDHCEEQEMELEALTAIFDDCLEIRSDTQPFQWAVTLYPEQHSEDVVNHVGIQLIATIPLEYPEIVPELEITLLKGLIDDHRTELLAMANEEAEANIGLPSIYAVCEKLREWLAENNVKGMDDVSMYAQMMRREKEAEKQSKKAQQAFESQKHVDEMTQAEAEELAVRKRRAEGTPCTQENFLAWKEKFEAEMALLAEKENDPSGEGGAAKKKNKEKVVDKAGRITGFLQFSDKGGGTFNFEAMEAAAENAQFDEDEARAEEEAAAAAVEDEDLFDLDDEDLDDLDFDDDDDDDDEEEPDI